MRDFTADKTFTNLPNTLEPGRHQAGDATRDEVRHDQRKRRTVEQQMECETRQARYDAACARYRLAGPESLYQAPGPAWYVEGVLLKGQPAILAGPEKTLKSSLALALSLVLAAMFPFLGHFAVPRQVRVALFSGEMQLATLASKARLIFDDPDQGVDLRYVSGWWRHSQSLPNLSTPRDLELLNAWLQGEGIEVVIIDPLCLCLFGGTGGTKEASNRHAMGPLFRSVADACLSAGATPLLVDHTRKHPGRKPLGLGDMAWAGPAEFARQWLLTNHRHPYDAAHGVSRLFLTVGASGGHEHVYEIDIHEGSLSDEGGSRTWDVLRIQPEGE